MGKLAITEFVTLDGVMEDPGGGESFDRGGWAFRFDRGADGDRFKFDELMAADVQFLGRRTYDGFAQAWPKMNDNEFGRKMNDMPKVVVSTTLTDPEWSNTTVISGNLADEIPALKARYDGDVLVAGSAQLAQSLLELGLVDELRLMVFPVVLGTGKKLFAENGPQGSFTLADVRQAGDCTILVLQKKEASPG